ncbi:hypothetical protein HMPREF0262_01665 [Clostridium sp. ATCC 29733]|nr:hypothetical protein HMPREF0262_01665 [Clostridium sp. ATCC 29733]
MGGAAKAPPRLLRLCPDIAFNGKIWRRWTRWPLYRRGVSCVEPKAAPFPPIPFSPLQPMHAEFSTDCPQHCGRRRRQSFRCAKTL